jgi:hypothetical protein
VRIGSLIGPLRFRPSNHAADSHTPVPGAIVAANVTSSSVLPVFCSNRHCDAFVGGSSPMKLNNAAPLVRAGRARVPEVATSYNRMRTVHPRTDSTLKSGAASGRGDFVGIARTFSPNCNRCASVTLGCPLMIDDNCDA